MTRKFIKLVNNERMNSIITSNKACTSGAMDTCMYEDNADCTTYAYDYCEKDYKACSGNGTEDVCGYDYGTCDTGARDHCSNVDN